MERIDAGKGRKGKNLETGELDEVVIEGQADYDRLSYCRVGKQ